MKIVLQNVLWLLVFVTYQYCCLPMDSVTLGVFFDKEENQSEIPLNATIYKKNVYDQTVQYKTNIKRLSKSHSCFDASKILCEVLSANDGVAAIFGVETQGTSEVLESVCKNFDIPYILTSWRATPITGASPVFNFFPTAELLQEGLAEVVKSLHWKSFVIIYENAEGLIKLQEVLKLQTYSEGSKRNSILMKQLRPESDQRALLKEIKDLPENNIILDCSLEKIIPILEQAESLNILNLHYNYLITSLDAHILDFSQLSTTANISTIRLFDVENPDLFQTTRKWNLMSMFDDNVRFSSNMYRTETLLFHDALLLLTDSINDLKHTDEIHTNSIDCSGSKKSTNGFRIGSYMRRKRPTLTLSGPVQFDDNGNRIDFNLHVVGILDEKVIATWNAATKTLNLTRSSSEADDAAAANLQKITVIVSSRIGEPYLMHRKAEKGQELLGNDRYEGYSMDLIKEIAKHIGFKFEFRLTEDKQYGKWDEKQRKWTGLIGDLLAKKAHLAICDLTITHQRREVVDFSLPFMTLGIGILYKKPEKKDINMFAFLDPFSVSVWIYTATLYLIISVVLFFISRMTPGDWENPHPCEDDPEELENIWDIKNCLWLTLGSIMTQGCDILPKGISSRMAVSMWWFFSLIMTSSYTANLAAFLTKDRMEPTIDGAEALSTQTKIKYGAVDGGSTMAFFRDSNFTTYQRMWMSMQQARPSVFEKSNADGVKRVQAPKGNYAFLMESTQIEYEEETKCNLKKVGGSLDTKSYGIAMPMNSAYRSAINKAILKLQESGKLADLKKRWWKEMRKEPSCQKSDSNDSAESADLALANIGGVFFVLSIGVGGAFILAICEFLWNVRSISVEEHITYWEALKVELKFVCNIWITRKRTKPLASESSSSGQKSDKSDDKSMVHNILHNTTSLTNINNSS